MHEYPGVNRCLKKLEFFSLSNFFFQNQRFKKSFSKIPPDTSVSYLLLKILFPLLLHTQFHHLYSVQLPAVVLLLLLPVQDTKLFSGLLLYFKSVQGNNAIICCPRTEFPQNLQGPWRTGQIELSIKHTVSKYKNPTRFFFNYDFSHTPFHFYEQLVINTQINSQ